MCPGNKRDQETMLKPIRQMSRNGGGIALYRSLVDKKWCIDANALGTEPGTKVHLWYCDAGNTNQVLQYENLRLRVSGTNRCLNIAKGKIDSGVTVSTAKCNDSKE